MVDPDGLFHDKQGAKAVPLQEIRCSVGGCRRQAALRSIAGDGAGFYVCGSGHATRRDPDGMGRAVGAAKRGRAPW